MIRKTYRQFSDFRSDIRKLPPFPPISKLRAPKFRLAAGEGLEIYYAPFDHINTAAKVVVVGITPGEDQMQIAFAAARQALHDRVSMAEACSRAKVAASFAGTMRNNLCKMMNGIGISDYLRITSTTSLFEENWELLHSTSVIRYPVFKYGENYRGRQPDILSSELLSRYVDDVLAPELARFPNSLIIPCGESVTSVLRYLITNGVLTEERCLLGFPHASGENGHRMSFFIARRWTSSRRLRRGSRQWETQES